MSYSNQLLYLRPSFSTFLGVILILSLLAFLFGVFGSTVLAVVSAFVQEVILIRRFRLLLWDRLINPRVEIQSLRDGYLLLGFGRNRVQLLAKEQGVERSEDRGRRRHRWRKRDRVDNLDRSLGSMVCNNIQNYRNIGGLKSQK